MVISEAMKTVPVSSYFEIAKVVNFLTAIISREHIQINNNFVPFVGILCSGINSEDLRGYKCRSNYYLKDSLGVDNLPPIDINSEKISPDSILRLCNGINDNLSHPPFDPYNMQHAAQYVCSIVLDVLREAGEIRGPDRFLISQHKSFLEDNGYLIIPSVLPKDKVKGLSDLTLMIAEEEHRAGESYRYGSEDNNLQRVYNLISKHPVYLELLKMPLVREILDFYFARDNLHHKYVMSSFQSNILYPGAPSQQLHVDGWDFTANPLPRSVSRLNLNFLLTDWNSSNGATMLLPKSHKLFRAPKPGEVSDKDLTKVIAPKGSLVVWTGHTWHKSGQNNSKKPRFGLFSCFAASNLKELCTEEEHLSVVDQEITKNLSPEFRFMLGLDRGIKRGAKYRCDFKGTEFEDFSLNGGV